MLNVAFTGDVYNNLELYDCKYQVLYVRQNIWSEVESTEYNQYNFNAGSLNHLGQYEELKTGDIIIVSFFDSSREEAHNENFCYIKITYQGESTLIKNIHLQSFTNPTCNWVLSGTYINRIISAYDLTSLDYNYTINGEIYYQNKQYLSYNIFPNLYITSKEYDFGNGYVSTNSNVYDEVGNYTVSQRLLLPTNEYIICQKNLTIIYEAPLGTITTDTENPNMYSSLNITFNSTNAYNNINNIIYSVNGVVINEDILEEYIYEYYIDSLGLININMLIEYNNFVENKTVNYNKSISIQNQPPILYFNPTEVNSSEWKFDFTYDKIDDDIKTFTYKIYYKLPFSEQYILDLSEVYNTDDIKSYQFLVSGDYRIELEIEDYGNNKVSEYKDISIICSGSEVSYVYATETYNRQPIRVHRVEDIDFNIDYQNIYFNSSYDMNKEFESDYQSKEFESDYQSKDFSSNNTNAINFNRTIFTKDFKIERIKD